MLIKKLKGTKKCVIKKIMFNNYVESLKEKKQNIKISTKI